MTSALGVVLTSAASAADLPRRAAPPVFTPVPVFTWTGFYAGLNAGYAFDTGDRRDGFVDRAPAAGLPGGNPVVFPRGVISPVAVFTPATSLEGRQVLFGDRGRDGFSGGAQIGYNYQFTPGSGVVVGVEADAQYLDFGRVRRSTISYSGPAAIIDPTFTPINGSLRGLDFFGTVRGRLGYAWDRTLVYATGGFAYGAGDDRIGNVAFTTPVVGNRDGFRTGWTVGGGVEYALPTDSFLNFFKSNAVTLKVEYLRYDLGSRNLLVASTGAPLSPGVGYFSRFRTEGSLVRAGLNFKFGTF